MGAIILNEDGPEDRKRLLHPFCRHGRCRIENGAKTAEVVFLTLRIGHDKVDHGGNKHHVCHLFFLNGFQQKLDVKTGKNQTACSVDYNGRVPWPQSRGLPAPHGT